MLQDENILVENTKLSKRLAKAEQQITSLLEFIGRVEDELAKEKAKVRAEIVRAEKLQVDVDSLLSELELEKTRTAALRDRAKKLLSSRKRQRRESDNDDE